MFGDRLDHLRRVPLSAVLQETGAQRDRYDQGKWHTPKGAISITGMKFMNWHQGLGGGGAIDLVMHPAPGPARAGLLRCYPNALPSFVDLIPMPPATPSLHR